MTRHSPEVTDRRRLTGLTQSVVDEYLRTFGTPLFTNRLSRLPNQTRFKTLFSHLTVSLNCHYCTHFHHDFYVALPEDRLIILNLIFFSRTIHFWIKIIIFYKCITYYFSFRNLKTQFLDVLTTLIIFYEQHNPPAFTVVSCPDYPVSFYTTSSFYQKKRILYTVKT